MIYRNGIYYDRMIRNGITYDRMIRNGVQYGAPDSPVGRVFNVGTGSGNLTINGATLGDGLVDGDIVNVAPGTYGDITLSNINVPAGRVTVRSGLGVVNVTGRMYSNGIRGAIISDFDFAGQTSVDAIYFTSALFKDVTISNCRFTNVNRYAVYWDGQALNYDGTDNTAALNIKIENCIFDNTWGIIMRGEADFSGAGVFTGYNRNFEVTGCHFSNLSSGDNQIRTFNSEDANIHGNTFYNINMASDSHSRTIHIVGNGKIHGNFVDTSRGNLAVFHCFSHGSTPKTVEIYNNIGFNGERYSVCEVQTLASLIDNANNRTTYANALIAFNTAVDVGLQTSFGFPAVVIDLYALFGGTATVRNNVGVNTRPAGNQWIGYDYVINSTGYVGTPVTSNNLPPFQPGDGSSPPAYPYPTIAEAGIEDTVDFLPVPSGPIYETGVTVAGIEFDFHGRNRANPPSIGACESD